MITWIFCDAQVFNFCENFKISHIRHSRLTLKCPVSLWNGSTVYTEKCHYTLKSIPPIKRLIDIGVHQKLTYQVSDWWKLVSVYTDIFSVSSVTIPKLT